MKTVKFRRNTVLLQKAYYAKKTGNFLLFQFSVSTNFRAAAAGVSQSLLASVVDINQ